MKNFIFLILLTLVSCEIKRIDFESESFIYECYIIKKEYVGPTTKIETYYNYDIFKEKFTLQTKTVYYPEKFQITYEFCGDTLTTNNKYLFYLNHDYFKVEYKKCYQINRNDTVFVKNKMINDI